MKRKWKEVYERLPIERQRKSLMEINGFTNYCTDVNAVREHIVARLGEEVPMSEKAHICEVGCGCGDKLFYFYQKGHYCYGIDYSKNMIKRVRQEMPQARLEVCEANKLPFEDNSMDFVFSYGVFLYFETEEYMYEVLEEMYRIAKPTAVVYIGDIPDIWEKENIIKLRGEPEEGYEHTFYDMNDFIQWFKAKDIKSVSADYTLIPGYKLSHYRFNITAKLNKTKGAE